MRREIADLLDRLPVPDELEVIRLNGPAEGALVEHGHGADARQVEALWSKLFWSTHGTAVGAITSLALAAGYADQAHLTREMRSLTGQLPTTLATGNPQSAVADLFKTPLA